jgi:hypothetical protein
VNVVAAPCGVPATARAFLFNATAIPSEMRVTLRCGHKGNHNR